MKILENEELPGKHAFIANLHSYLGNVCIGKRDLDTGLQHHNLDLEIGEKQWVYTVNDNIIAPIKFQLYHLIAYVKITHTIIT